MPQVSQIQSVQLLNYPSASCAQLPFKSPSVLSAQALFKSPSALSVQVPQMSFKSPRASSAFKRPSDLSFIKWLKRIKCFKESTGR